MPPTHFPTSGDPATPGLRLVCHPATPNLVPLTLSCHVSVDPNDGALLRLRYELQADLSLLRVPAAATPGAADGLWQHTCFEAFARSPGASAYQEYNFSPSGQWAAYRFAAQRVRDVSGEVARRFSSRALTPQLLTEQQPGRLVLLASLPLDALPTPTPAPAPDGSLRLALSAVVEDSAGRLSYWALHHPAERPDFHHPGGFVHTLPLPARP